MNFIKLIIVIFLCAYLKANCEFFNLDSVINIYSNSNGKIIKEKNVSKFYLSPVLKIMSVESPQLLRIGCDSKWLSNHNSGSYYVYQVGDSIKYYDDRNFYYYVEVEDDERDTTISFNRLIKKVSRRQLEVDIDTLKPKYIFLIKESTDSTLVYKALNPLENFTNPDSKENPKRKLIEQYFYFSIREKYKIE